MRAIAIAISIVLVAACGDSTEMSSCPTMVTSNIQNRPGPIIAGESVIGMAWLRDIGRGPPEVHGSIVTSDGVIGPDIALLDHAPTGAAGTTTVAWTTPGCVTHPFTVSLQRGGEVTRLEIVMTVKSSDIVFDGQRYQLVWTTQGGTLEHRSLDEDGTLGPVHVLAQVSSGVCVEAATDRAGTTFVRANDTGYIIDTVTGDKRLVFSAPGVGPGESFYFAGQFHVHEEVQVMSFPPTSTGAYTVHLLGGLPFAQRFYATPTRLFVVSATGVIESDANFNRIGSHGVQQSDLGTIGDDLVTYARTELDPFARTPGRLELLRAAGEKWRVEVAVDSPVIDEELCDKPE